MVELEEVLSQFREAYKQKLIDTGHNSSGNLGKSMRWQIRYTTSGYHIEITLPDYAFYLENGTRPHFPPVDAIKKWIRIKKILPRPMSNGKLPTKNQLAYLIGRKISRVGTPATNVLNDTIDEFELVNRLYAAVSQEIQNQMVSNLAG